MRAECLSTTSLDQESQIKQEHQDFPEVKDRIDLTAVFGGRP